WEIVRVISSSAKSTFNTVGAPSRHFTLYFSSSRTIYPFRSAGSKSPCVTGSSVTRTSTSPTRVKYSLVVRYGAFAISSAWLLILSSKLAYCPDCPDGGCSAEDGADEDSNFLFRSSRMEEQAVFRM